MAGSLRQCMSLFPRKMILMRSIPISSLRKLCSSARTPRPESIKLDNRYANLVKLVGVIEEPIKPIVTNDGKLSAETVLRVDSTRFNLVFEETLVKIAMGYFNQFDEVYVSGSLFSIQDKDKRHLYKVLVNTLNYIKSRSTDVVSKESSSSSGTQRNFGPKEIGNAKDNLWKSYFYDRSMWWDLRSKKAGPDSPDFQHKLTGQMLHIDKTSTPRWVKWKIAVPDPFATSPNHKYKPAESLWKEFFQDPSQWKDQRNVKWKATLPDFKHKKTSEGLWIDERTPEWVKLDLGLSESDASTEVSQQENALEKVKDKRECLWNEFFANPLDWWDNRNKKRNPKAPDFTHKETGEGLWIDGSDLNPEWVRSQLVLLDSRKRSELPKELLNSFQDSDIF